MIEQVKVPPSPESNLGLKQNDLNDFFWLLLLGLIMVVAIGLRLWYGSFVIDDAYITFRYAQNLAEGNGLVYNLDGRHILGTTTPLFTLVLAGLHRIGFSLEGASLWISILSDCATISLLYLFGRRLNAPAPGLAAGALVALWIDYLNYAASGMETSLYTAMIVGVSYLYLQRKFGLTGLLSGLLVLIRPDGLLLAIVLFGHYLWRERRLPWRMGLAFAPLPLLWAACAWLYFGSPVSQSLVAKASQKDTTPAESVIQLLIFLNQSVKPALTILAVLGIFAVLRGPRFRLMRLPLAWVALYCLVFISQGAFRLFPWYYIPLLPFYFLLALIGLVSFGQALGKTIRQGKFLRPVLGGVALLVAIGLFWLALVNRQVLADEQVGREVLYKDVATRLLLKLPSGEQIASNEIGALGYFCRCQIYDLAGLITPEVVGKSQLAALQQARPMFIINYNNLVTPETFNSSWLKQNYELIEVHPVLVWGENELYIFRRR